MLYREAGQFKATYAEDMAIFPIRQIALGILLGFIRGAVAGHFPHLAVRQRV